MSLVVDITINRIQDVGLITVQRIEGGTEADDVNRYKYLIMDDGGFTLAEGYVMHRYGDKAFRLLAKVLLDCQESL